jgi:hypothetical protein
LLCEEQKVKKATNAFHHANKIGMNKRKEISFQSIAAKEALNKTVLINLTKKLRYIKSSI